MISLKTPEEIGLIRAAGRIVAACHAALPERIRPGVQTRELEEFVADFLAQRGATPSCKGYRGFPGAICVAINDVICHGMPGDEQLREGDVITVDIMACRDGFHADSAWTYAAGKVPSSVRRLMQAGLQCLLRGIAQARPGGSTGDIGHAIQTHAEAHQLGVVREFTGHGVGRSLHEPPALPHYGRPHTGVALQAGMVLAIEPMITLGDWRSRLERDGWTARTLDGSLCVQYEHTVAVTDHGPEILTQL